MPTLVQEQQQQNKVLVASPQTFPALSHSTTSSYVDHSMEAGEPSTTAEKELNNFYYQEQIIGSAFPLKLQTLLRFMATNGLEHIAGWFPHGRSFAIFNPKEFEKVVMGRFFNQSKLASFIRQLNLYNFKRIAVGPDAGSYYHEMFLRGKPFLATKIIRTRIKGAKAAIGGVDKEPNLYSFPSMPELHAENNYLHSHDNCNEEKRTSKPDAEIKSIPRMSKLVQFPSSSLKSATRKSGSLRIESDPSSVNIMKSFSNLGHQSQCFGSPPNIPLNETPRNDTDTRILVEQYLFLEASKESVIDKIMLDLGSIFEDSNSGNDALRSSILQASLNVMPFCEPPNLASISKILANAGLHAQQPSEAGTFNSGTNDTSYYYH